MTSTSTFSPVLTGDYTIDLAHSRLGFVARHAMVTKVRGSFQSFDGALHVDAEDPTKSSANFTVEVASVDTANAQRDEHLRTNDFFDVPNYPQITFASTRVEPRDAEHFNVAGDLTIRGITKPVTIELEFTGPARDPYGNQRIGFEGTTVLNRKDFGVNFNAALETGGVLVSEKVTLEIDISAIKNS
ncbi:MAG: YceI family protein [Acidimicrobiales bacterium]